MTDWRKFGEDIPTVTLDGEVPPAIDRRQCQDDARFDAMLEFKETVRNLGFSDEAMFERHKRSDTEFNDIVLLALYLDVSYFVAEQKFFDQLAEARVQLEEARQARVLENISRMIFSR